MIFIPGGSMGFGQLVSTGQYGTFITYVNSLNALVKAAGMKTVAFNDGFYFNGNTTFGTLDTDITVSFWTSGWSGYQSASAAELAAMGHPMTNTHGDYYYAVGKMTSGIPTAILWLLRSPTPSAPMS